MAVIHVLDKHTAELIAAGEVVERPSSVVKELVENAVDAGSTAITVEITRGGVESIVVSDNGSGIEAEYISTAFIRHATSKIAAEEDLNSIQTLGFRGEALASISAVSRVELLTRTAADEYACLYRQEGGEEISVEAAARPVGTTITVRDLFYNVPARMKFLKKDASEGNYVADVVLRQALAHPEIAFRFIREGKEQFQTPGDGELMSAIYTVLARDFSKNLLTVTYEQGTLGVEGYVSAPIACRGSRSMQFFFINGRCVQDRTLMAALETAYKGVMMQGKFPGCVLNIVMPPERVDVNVHPAKTEVRFANAGEIFDLVYKAVRGKVIGKDTPQKHLDLSATQSAPKPEPVQKPRPAPQSVFTPIQTSIPQLESVQQAPSPSPAPSDFGGMLRQTAAAEYRTKRDSMSLEIQKTPEEEFAPPEKTVPEVPSTPQSTQSEPQREKKEVKYIGEAFATYIITECGDELVLIDKHAAHERILYEKLRSGYGRRDGQLLLEPISINLSAAEKNALLAGQELLEGAGFEIEDFGGLSVLVRSVPSELPPENTTLLIEEIAARLATGSRDTMNEKTDWLLHSIACRAAIKAGDKDPAESLLALAGNILSGEVPPFCPHGRPVLIRLSQKELEKQFGRRE